jgi:hypothetical protein
MSVPPSRFDSIYDPVGTSHLFHHLATAALLLAWKFDEQMHGAPPDVLDVWRSLLVETDAYLADVRRELDKTRRDPEAGGDVGSIDGPEGAVGEPSARSARERS